MSNTTNRLGRMHNPPHPGEILMELGLKPLSLTIKDGAKALGVSSVLLSRLVHGHSRVSIDMARRLSKAFRTSVEVWLNLQLQHDLWLIRTNKSSPQVKPLVPKRAISA
jgi:addiction module HigA family antidote